jgi:hypothetical protein
MNNTYIIVCIFFFLTLTKITFGQKTICLIPSISMDYIITIDSAIQDFYELKRDSIYSFKNFHYLSIELNNSEGFINYLIDFNQSGITDTIHLDFFSYERIDTVRVRSNCENIKNTLELQKLNTGNITIDQLPKYYPIKINGNYLPFNKFIREIIEVETGNCVEKTGYTKSTRKQIVVYSNMLEDN